MAIERTKQQMHAVHDRLAGRDPPCDDRIEMNRVEVARQPREESLIGHPEAKRRHRAVGCRMPARCGRSGAICPCHRGPDRTTLGLS